MVSFNISGMSCFKIKGSKYHKYNHWHFQILEHINTNLISSPQSLKEIEHPTLIKFQSASAETRHAARSHRRENRHDRAHTALDPSTEHLRGVEAHEGEDSERGDVVRCLAGQIVSVDRVNGGGGIGCCRRSWRRAEGGPARWRGGDPGVLPAKMGGCSGSSDGGGRCGHAAEGSRDEVGGWSCEGGEFRSRFCLG